MTQKFLRMYLKINFLKLYGLDKKYDNNEMCLKQLTCFIEFVEEGRIKHNYDIEGGLESLWVVDSFLNSENQKNSKK